MHRHFPKEEMLLFNKHGKCLTVTANQSQQTETAASLLSQLLVFKMIMGTAPVWPPGRFLFLQV